MPCMLHQISFYLFVYLPPFLPFQYYFIIYLINEVKYKQANHSQYLLILINTLLFWFVNCCANNKIYITQHNYNTINYVYESVFTQSFVNHAIQHNCAYHLHLARHIFLTTNCSIRDKCLDSNPYTSNFASEATMKLGSLTSSVIPCTKALNQNSQKLNLCCGRARGRTQRVTKEFSLPVVLVDTILLKKNLNL